MGNESLDIEFEDLKGSPDGGIPFDELGDEGLVVDPSKPEEIEKAGKQEVVDEEEDKVTIVDDRDEIEAAARKNPSGETMSGRYHELDEEDVANTEHLLAQLLERGKENADLRTRLADQEVQRLNDMRASTQAKLSDAIEQGDTEAQTRLQDDLISVRASLIDAEQKQEQAKTDSERPAEVLNPFMGRWRKRNGWFDDKNNSAQHALTLQIDKELANMGMSPYSQSYFTRIDEELRKRDPEFFKKLDEDSGDPELDPPQKKKIRSVAGVSRSSPVRKASSGKVTLTRSDLETMAKFGLDTKNRAHLVEFAKNKRSKQE
jgi:hypothetical protein